MSDMNIKLILAAHKAIFERGPVVDPHITAFKRQCERDVQLRDLVQPVYARVSEEDCDAAFDAETQQAYFGTDRR